MQQTAGPLGQARFWLAVVALSGLPLFTTACGAPKHRTTCWNDSAGMKCSVDGGPPHLSMAHLSTPPQYEARAQAEREAQERDEEAARKAREAEEARRRFYATYPGLKGREKCVARVLKARSPISWDDLGVAASSVCLPSEQWVKVFVDVDGHSTFVDPTRVEFRQGDQVTFWELVDAFDDEHDFLLSRTIVDCDKEFWATISSSFITGGTYGAVGDHPPEWHSVLPNTQGEAMLNMMCNLRAARLAKPASPPARPQPQPVLDTLPMVTPML